ncbi:unnamed protein product [Chrysoparadoxa australica]
MVATSLSRWWVIAAVALALIQSFQRGSRSLEAVGSLQEKAVPNEALVIVKDLCFQESGAGLLSTLTKLGVPSQLVDLQSAPSRDVNELLSRPDKLYIIFGGHDFIWGHLPPYFVAMQLEQREHSLFHDESYQQFLQGALSVWDFSPAHVKHWKQLGWSSHRVPHYLDAGIFDKNSYISRGLATPPEEQPVDILFYGYMCERRDVIYRQLKAMAEAHNLRVVFASESDGYDIGGLYGAARDEALSMSKVVLSMQYYDHSTVTTHRLAYLMAMGKAIVCERGSDEVLPRFTCLSVITTPRCASRGAAFWNNRSLDGFLLLHHLGTVRNLTRR